MIGQRTTKKSRRQGIASVLFLQRLVVPAPHLSRYVMRYYNAKSLNNIIKVGVLTFLVSFSFESICFSQGKNVGTLIQNLKDKNRNVRSSAASALGDIKDTRAVEPLIAALKDKNSIVRRLAASALAKIMDTRAVVPLIAALKDKDADVRACAAWALGDIKDSRAVEPLIAALKDKDLMVRDAAKSVLGAMGIRADEVVEKDLGPARAAAIKALPNEKKIDVKIIRHSSGYSGAPVPAAEPVKPQKSPPSAPKSPPPAPARYNFLVITVHLYEGYAFDDPTSTLRKGKRTTEGLETLANQRCANILKAIWQVRCDLPYLDRIMVVTTHGVNVTIVRNIWPGPLGSYASDPKESSSEIYAVSMSFSDFLKHDLSKMKNDEIMQFTKVELNHIPSLKISSTGDDGRRRQSPRPWGP